MEVLIIFMLCLSFTLFPKTHCFAYQQVFDHLSTEQQAQEVKLSTTKLPRKLKFLEEISATISSPPKFEVAKDLGGLDSLTPTTQKMKADNSGNHLKNNKGKIMHGKSKGTWREWMDATETSQYFTMDYSHVRRRRPVHNKSLPVGP